MVNLEGQKTIRIVIFHSMYYGSSVIYSVSQDHHMLPFSFSPREKDGAIPVHGRPPLQIHQFVKRFTDHETFPP
jgi:hypothetical protein